MEDVEEGRENREKGRGGRIKRRRSMHLVTITSSMQDY